MRLIFAKLMLAAVSLCCRMVSATCTPEESFLHPPQSATVGVWWHWMGRQVTKDGIAKDLDWMRRMGIGSATVFAMADTTTPWARRIGNVPTDIERPYSENWWDCFRFACAEGRKRGIEIGIHNCPGYTSTGGSWITPDLSMRELVFNIEKPEDVPLAPNAQFPVFCEDRKVYAKPNCPARRTDIQNIAVVKGIRVSHVPMGSFVQPCDWANFGLECDKMNPVAVKAHLDHVFGELHRHLGPDLRAAGLTHMLLDSYEAGTPSWTPRMPEEFKKRRGYDPIPYLPVLGGFTNGYTAAGCERFRVDFTRTIQELYRDVLFRLMHERIRAEGLQFSCEPYKGPFVTGEVVKHIDRVMTEFWYGADEIADYQMWQREFCGPDGCPHRIIEAEAFTGWPEKCAFTETPLELKVTGDLAYLNGVNRFVLHSVVHQPWGDEVRPGVTMGRWGTHFGRNQVWGAAEKRWFDYCRRAQALLQWGSPSDARIDIPVSQIAREGKDGETVFFLVNRVGEKVRLGLSGTWFDPVSGRITRPPTELMPTQSGFLRLGISPEEEPDAYSPDLFKPDNTWAELLENERGLPQDVDYEVAPCPGGKFILSYPEWWAQGVRNRPSGRKYFSTWLYEGEK